MFTRFGKNPLAGAIMTLFEKLEPARIAFVSTMGGVSWGGSEELWSGTAKRMRSRGHEVGISVFGWPETPRQIRELSELGCEIDFRPLQEGIVSRVIGKCIQRVGRNGTPPSIRKWLKRMKPGLVVISQGWPLEGVAWMLACRKLGIRYGVIVHAASEIWWPEDEAIELLREGYGGAAGLYFVSKANCDLVEMQFGMRFENASVVSNPRTVDVADSLPWPTKAGMVEIACVGRMDPRPKGQDVLLKVLAMERWRNRPLRVNFYGCGPCKGSIRRLSEFLGLENVRFHGQVSDIEEIWSANQALVLPSRFEGLPLVIVEAMLCGRPVITTDVAGNAEYVRDGVNGFLAPAPTAPLLDETLERAWAARPRWKEMGERARRDALARLPDDPIDVFVAKLRSIARQGEHQAN